MFSVLIISQTNTSQRHFSSHVNLAPGQNRETGLSRVRTIQLVNMGPFGTKKGGAFAPPLEFYISGESFSTCLALYPWGRPSFLVACRSHPRGNTMLYYRRRLPHLGAGRRRD